VIISDEQLVSLKFVHFEFEKDLGVPALPAIFVSLLAFLLATLSCASESASFRTEVSDHTEFVLSFISIPPPRA